MDSLHHGQWLLVKTFHKHNLASNLKAALQSKRILSELSSFQRGHHLDYERVIDYFHQISHQGDGGVVRESNRGLVVCASASLFKHLCSVQT